MFRYDFEQSLIYRVCTASQAMEKALNEELAPLGITHRQWQVLGWLALEGGLSQAELAERMRVEPPTLAGIVERMERDGWLERAPCPEDRRKKRLTPTDRVGPVWEAIASAARRVRARAAEGFSEAELNWLLDALERIRSNVSSPPNHPAPAPTPAFAEDHRR
ncbi:MarR family winged helix-turn-helix transcriptional regulator [Tautonia plasticadhaerens]|uniref:Transcriptional activatory protein BadR n=1 Tax=Tautonia plasticadhaerens TaxID=2527974 RepID=A0A518HCR0_9BACT|nr:MarR family transcriptional regulator [Tautonia plasticadhaerens]QDV38620.1 Transcriptional activatory protein BadR [Tautonia plasticadhaerens]